jgi:membrane protease YdiL (CAAX protease family)
MNTTSPAVAKAQPLLTIAWVVMLLTIVPEIVLRAFLQADTAWITPVRMLLLAVLVAVTFVWDWIRPLRGFFMVMLGIYVFEAWLMSSVVLQSQAWVSIFGTTGQSAFFGERVVRLGAVVLMFGLLTAMGFKRKDLYLQVGDLRAPFEPVGWLGIKKPEPWTRFGRNYAIVLAILLLVFLVPAFRPDLSKLSIGIVLFAAVCAVINAFAEEFLYRSALLPQLLPLFGKSSALLLAAWWFGLGHWFGVPNGLTGVLLTAFGGWIFGKSMIETKGMGWAMILHFISDFLVYMVLLLAAVI